MSWFHSSAAGLAARDHASPADIVACFEDQRSILGRLAFLITGDQAAADQAVVQACEITLQGNSPFRDWLLEWAKAATIASAISHGTEAIRICEAAYKDQRCPHVEHLSPGDAEERAASLDLILGADAQTPDCGIGSAVPGCPGTQSCNQIVDSRLRFTPERVPRGRARCQLSRSDVAS